VLAHWSRSEGFPGWQACTTHS